MRLLSALVPALAVATATSPQHLFSNPTEPSASRQMHPRIPSIHESTVQARRILQLQSIATLSTIFPAAASSEDVSVAEERPPDVGTAPIGLMEYYAACGPEPYNPTILGVTIATTMKNAAAGSNVTLSARYMLPADAPLPPPDPWAYLPANLPRFALVGHLERVSDADVARHNLTACFFHRHPEARIWAPGMDVHPSWWARLVVEEVYFFGGFGDRARIAWLPIDDWRGTPQHEVDEYRLVGEKDFSPQPWTDGAQTPLAEEL